MRTVGEKYAKVDTKANKCREEGKQRYAWQDSQFSRRSDGKGPADYGGFSADEDFTGCIFIYPFKISLTSYEKALI